jgi:hypothetical protein
MAEIEMGPRGLSAAIRAGITETANNSRRDKVSLVGVSGQCMNFEGRGIHSNGATYRAIADEAYEGITADDASLGVPLRIIEDVIPDRF